MSVDELLIELSARGITLSAKGGMLIIRGEDKILSSSSLLDSLRQHKQRLIEMIEAGEYVEVSSGGVNVPPNLIWEGCERITPQMLTLVQLSQEEIDSIVHSVPGGAANVQDIYPLAPLQEGILYYYLLQKVGDPYLLQTLLSFDRRERLDAFIRALQAVIGRHDVLRTAVKWEGLNQPVQVVLRQAPLVVEEVTLEGDDVAQQLWDRYSPRHYRLDVRQAPLMRLFAARQRGEDRWWLLWLAHHLCGDHTTLGLIQREVGHHLSDRAAELPKPLAFRKFVAQARLSVPHAEHEAYFRNLLGDVTETTAPFGLVDVQGDGSLMVDASRDVNQGLAMRLRQRARALGVSVASVCHVAFAQLLSRVSGRKDVTFGTLLFGRMQGIEGADWTPGLFVNTLPVRIGVSVGAEQGVREAHAQLIQLLRHEHAPLALAQRCSGVAAPAPLFCALLNYRHNQEQSSKHVDNAWEGIRLRRSQERATYPLALSIDDLGERLVLTSHVQSPIDPQRVCDYMHTALESLVDGLERSPHSAVNNLPVLPNAERRKILREWNATPATTPQERCLHELFELQSARTPNAVAVTCQGQHMTYGELNARANQLARYLQAQEIGPESIVGLCLERSAEMVVGILGVLKAGAGYVPLDPSYPSERLQLILRDASPRAVLTQRKFKDLIPSATAVVVSLDERSNEIAVGGTENLQAAQLGASSGNLAYVIYTSGSTGQPKGVQVEHRNVTRLFDMTAHWFHFEARDVWALFHSVAFDFSVWELWGALLHGGRLVIVPQEVSRQPDELYDLLCGERVTVLNQTPSAFRHLMVAQQSSVLQHELRYVIFGGEALEPSMLKPWCEREENRRTKLVNMYGITETTVHVTYRSLEAADMQSSASPIGRRIGDLRIYILDDRLQLAPGGVAGEMYVAGAGVARGYLNRTDLTAERFIADPYAAQPGARMYRTGDLGRYLPDGSLEFLGRNDFQVKIRGYRIELGEIEAKLREHGGVRDAVVIAREEQADKRLLAYYRRSGQAVSVEALRSHLQTQLPEYMVPSAYVEVEQWPLTPTGKLDRNRLPAPGAEAHAVSEYEPPEGETEAMLAAIWSELLGVARVGRHDNFFELGGHSLSATRLILRVRAATQVEVSLESLLEKPTLASFAELVLDQQLASFATEDLEELATRL